VARIRKEIAPPSDPLAGTNQSVLDDRGRSEGSKPVAVDETDLLDTIELLQRVTHSLERAVPNSEDGAESLRPPSRRAMADRAKAELSRRRQRYALFGRAMFGEHAWEALLLLYIERDQVGLTFSRIAQESGAPRSTVRRWLDYLETQQLVRRSAHATDRRAACIELTDKAAHALDSYFS